MEEKKLNDEEIIKDLKFCVEQEDCVRCKYDDCVDCRAFLMEEALDFIHRLQDEKKELQESADLFNDFNEKLTGIIEGQKVEIERLTKENKQLEEEIDLEVDLQTQRKRQIIAESQEFVDELANKNAELQKQVDESMRKIESYQHSFEYIQGYEDGKKQEVKDTVKEILQELYDQIDENTPKWVGEQIKIIAKRKGVEVWNND